MMLKDLMKFMTNYNGGKNMDKQKIITLIKEEIGSYQDLNAPEKMALSRLLSKIDWLEN